MQISQTDIYIYIYIYVCIYAQIHSPTHIHTYAHLALHVISGDNEARGARVHDGRSSVFALGVRLELEKLHSIVVLETELERRSTNNEVLRRERCVCVCVCMNVYANVRALVR
jgi:hypothetical protein